MYTKDEKRFIELRQKLVNEANEIKAKMGELEARYEHIAAVLSGEVEPELDNADGGNPNITVEEEVELEWLLQLIKSRPGISRKEIVEQLDVDVARAKRLLDKARKRGLIASQGPGRASAWYTIP